MLSDAWALAIETLCLIEQKRLSEKLALATELKRLRVENPNVIGLANKLVCETVRRQNFIDHMSSGILKSASMDELHPKVRAFLRLFVYSAKIEGRDNYRKAVAAAKIGRSILGWQRLERVEEFLGSCLGLDPERTLEGLGDIEKVSLQVFLPRWFVKYCFRLLGRYEALRYFDSTNSSPATYIRLNTLGVPEERLLKGLNEEGIILEKVEGLLHTYRVVDKKGPLTGTSSFKNGWFYIQDKASCLAAEVAAPRPGMTVLDICAAPGAKTTYLAQLMRNQGAIYSLDYSRRRMAIWKREIRRMHANIAVPLIADAYNPFPFGDLEADLVILDPPCTGTGTFSRIPSAKWRLSKRSLKHMSALQWRMLNNSAGWVKEGGSLVYSTCSITVEENEILIERFLKQRPEFILDKTKPHIGTSGLRGQNLSQRLYPHIHKCNGFFIAKLTKEI